MRLAIFVNVVGIGLTIAAVWQASTSASSPRSFLPSAPSPSRSSAKISESSGPGIQ